MPAPGCPSGSRLEAERLADGRAHVVGERHLGARARRARRGRRSPRSSRCGGGPGGAIGTAPSNGQPGGVREQVAHRRAGRPGRLVEVDDALLGGDERRERAHRLRDRGEARPARRASPRRRDRGRRHRSPRPRRTARPSRRSGAVPPSAGDTTPAMERRLISGHSPFEPVAGFSRAVVVGSTVHVAGTAPIPPDGSPTPESAYEQARLCLAIIAEALERAGVGRRTSSARGCSSPTPRTGARSRAPTARSSPTSGRRRPASSRRCSTRPGRSRSRRRR